MNTETQREGKKAIKNVLTDVQDVLSEYVGMIANDQVSFEDYKSVAVIHSMMTMLIAVIGHMHIDRLAEYDEDKLSEIAVKLARYDSIKESCTEYMRHVEMEE